MTVSARTGLKALGFLLALVALAGFALIIIFQSRPFRDWLQAEVSRRTGYEVRAASLGFRPPFTILADGVQIANAQQFQFNASRLSATLNPFDFVSPTIYRLEVDGPILQLDIDEMMKLPTKGTAQIALRRLQVQKGTVVLKKGAQTILELPRMNLTAENINLAEQSGVRLRADVPQLNGEAEVRIQGQPREFESEITIRPKPSKSLLAQVAKPRTPGELLHLRIKLRAPEQRNASATIESKFNQLTIGATELTGTLEAQLTIDPGFSAADFSSQATLTDFPNNFSPVPLQLAAGTAAVTCAGKFSIPGKTLTVNTCKLKSPFGNGVGEGQVTFVPEPKFVDAKLVLRDLPLDTFKAHFPAPLNRWSYQGQGQMTLNLEGAWNTLGVKGTIHSDTIEVRGDEMAVANISVSAPFEWTKPTLRFTATKIRANKLAYTPKERWQAATEKLQLDAAFDYQAGQAVRLSGLIESAGVKFSSADSAKVGENLSLRGPFELVVDPAKSAARLSGKFSAGGGELLWGKFFGDLKSQSPVLELDADYLHGQDRLDCRRCNLNLAKVGRFEIGGAIEHLTETPVLHLHASSANFSPSGFFDFFLRETFNRQYPILDKLAVGGQMAFRLQLEGKLDAINVAGNLSLKGGELRVKSDDWQIGPIALDLPLRVRLAPTPQKENGAPRIGTMKVERVRFANQTVAPIATTISLWGNALRFHRPMRLGIFGGEIEIGNLFWPDVINDPKQVSFSAEAKRLNLEDMTQAMNWPRFSGMLTGSIPAVQSTKDILRTRGEVQAALFGGQVRIAKLEIENPFSALASIKLDAQLTDIELEQLSKTFAFGRISGTLEGSVDGLVLTAGQPSELSADLRSVDRGGEQRISVEALNKITVLSSGQEAGALYGGLASFFDSFRYSKLGFKAHLKNDRLTLRGVESRGDQEYLVVGSFLPPTVNVVSHTQVIAFSELLRRLERINKSDKPSVQ
jgi:hypothetical protein